MINMKYLQIFLGILLISSCREPAKNTIASIRHAVISDQSVSLGNDNNLFRAVQKNADGNYLLQLRVMPDSGSKEEKQYGVNYFLKMSPNGEVLGKKRISPDNFPEQYVETADGFYGVTHDFDTMIPDGDNYLKKYDKDWNVIWSKKISKPGSPDATILLALTNKKELLIVTNEIQLPRKPVLQYGVAIRRYTPDGKMIAEKFYAKKGLINSVSLIEVADHNYLLSNLYLPGKLTEDMWLLKINNEGDTLWTKTYASFSPGQSLRLKDSGFLFYGTGYDCSDKKTDSCRFLTITKTDRYGNILWKKEMRQNSSEKDGNVIELANHHFFFAAVIQPAKDKIATNYIFELDTDGKMVYDKKFDFPTNGYFVPLLIQGNKQVIMVSEKNISKFGDRFHDVIVITKLAE